MVSFLKKHSKKIALAVAGIGLIAAGQTEEGLAMLKSIFSVFGG